MTDGAADDRRARIEALKSRRVAADTARRGHPAANTRIGAAALGVAAMFGIVAAMGVGRPATVSASAPAPAPVRISTPSTPAANPGPIIVTPEATARIVRPSVRTVIAPTPAPTARTHGSR